MKSPSQNHSNSARTNLKLVAIAGGLSLVAIGLMQNTKSRTSSTLDGDTPKAPISETTGGPLLAVNNMSYRNPANRGSYRDVVDEMYGTNNTPTFPSVLAGIHEEIPENTPRVPGAAVHIPHNNAGPRVADTNAYYGINTVPATDDSRISSMSDDEFIAMFDQANRVPFFSTSLTIEEWECVISRLGEIPYFQGPEIDDYTERLQAEIHLRIASMRNPSTVDYETAKARIRAEAEAIDSKQKEGEAN